MIGKVFCLKTSESKSVGYQYIVNPSNKKRIEDFDFEESSIDLGAVTTPRIVVKDIVYEIVRQYFVKDSSGSTERILLLYPVLTAAENGEAWVKKETGR